MEPQEYLAVLRKRWIMIIAIAIVGAGIAFAYSTTLPTLYRSTSSVFVSSQRGVTSSEILQGSNFTQAQVQSYAQLASLPQVLDPVIDRLDLPLTAEQLAGSVTADIRLNTVIIDISVSSRSPENAARIANAVTDSLSDQAEALAPSTEQGSAITMTTVAPARVPTGAFAPNTRLIVASGFLGGLVLAVAGALGRELLDTRIRSRRDIERVTDVPLLGSVARRPKGQKPLVMLVEPRSRYAEDHRRIATNLDFADVDEPVRSVVVSSATQAEGKTTTSINLALAMAERLQRVLLIDADLRRPSVATSCGIEGSVGLTSVLLGTATIDDAIRSWAGGAIDVMPSGAIPANPGQILGSEAMAVLMENLLERYDFVVVDSPPLLPVIDAVTVSKLVDGAVLVVRSGATRRQQVVDALATLEGVGAKVFGVVLNGVPARATPAYYGQGSSLEQIDPRADGSIDATDGEISHLQPARFESRPVPSLDEVEVVVVPASETPPGQSSEDSRNPDADRAPDSSEAPHGADDPQREDSSTENAPAPRKEQTEAKKRTVRVRSRVAAPVSAREAAIRANGPVIP